MIDDRFVDAPVPPTDRASVAQFILDPLVAVTARRVELAACRMGKGFGLIASITDWR